MYRIVSATNVEQCESEIVSMCAVDVSAFGCAEDITVCTSSDGTLFLLGHKECYSSPNKLTSLTAFLDCEDVSSDGG